MAENHVLLETINLTQSASSVTFDNIPQTGYTDLKIIASALGNTTEGMYIRFNGSTSNFDGRYLYADGTSPSSAVLARYLGSITASPIPNSCEIYIQNYTSSIHKTYSVDEIAGTTTTTGYANIISGQWFVNSSITSITIEAGAGFNANSTFSIYGIAALGTTPTISPKATGGNIVANDGTYWYHAFLTSGFFTPQTSLTCDVLQVAGGGGGGAWTGGAGGAGGVLAFSSQSLTSQNYSCIVGAGGTGGASPLTPSAGSAGSNTFFQGLASAIGGGPGQGYPNFLLPLPVGGSGGGGTTASGDSPLPAAGTAGQGFAGGTGFGGATYAGGGGGGAGAVGGNGSSGGKGGAGTSSVTNWGSLSAALTATSLGVSGVIAGGGSGGVYATTPLTGGAGGGGTGGAALAAAAGRGGNGVASTGGGGGGGGSSGSAGSEGGQGGSGIIIVRYPMAS